MLNDDDDDGDVGRSDGNVLVEGGDDSPRQAICCSLARGLAAWRRRFVPWSSVAGAAASVLSYLSSPVLTPLSMKRSVVVLSGPQMMFSSACRRGDCFSPVYCWRQCRCLLPDNPREPLTRCCLSFTIRPAVEIVAGTTLPSPPWEVGFAPPDFEGMHMPAILRLFSRCRSGGRR